MFKLLLFGLIIWMLILVLRSKWQQPVHPKQHTATQEEQVVPCAQCGIHIPVSTAIKHHQFAFCSQQHCDDHDVANT